MEVVQDKTVVTQQEYVKPKTGGMIRRHCARWWWVHLIIFLCLTVLLVCIAIFVVVPKIAQSRVNGSTLTVQGIGMSNSKSDSFTLSLNATIHADNAIHAVLDPFTAEMYLEDLPDHTPFLYVDLPQTSSDTVSTVNITQERNITDMAAFTTFNKWLLLNETIRVTIKGSTKIRITAISHKYTVHYKKTVTIPGLQNFNGSDVSYATISLTAGAGENDFIGYASIPDTSIVHLEIGNVTWDTYLFGEYVGPSHLENVVLSPGTAATINNFTMFANITEAAVVEGVGAKPYCSTGILPFEFHGVSVVNNGENLTYFTESLDAKNQTMDIDIGSILKSSLGIPLACAT